MVQLNNNKKIVDLSVQKPVPIARPEPEEVKDIPAPMELDDPEEEKNHEELVKIYGEKVI